MSAAWADFLAAMEETDETEQTRLLGATLSEQELYVASAWYTSGPRFSSIWSCDTGACDTADAASTMLRPFENYIRPVEFEPFASLLNFGGADSFANGFRLWKGKTASNLTLTQFAVFRNDLKITWHCLFRVGGSVDLFSRQVESQRVGSALETLRLQWEGDKDPAVVAAGFTDDPTIWFYTDEEGLQSQPSAEIFAAKLFSFPCPPLPEDFASAILNTEPRIEVIGYALRTAENTADNPLPNFNSFVMMKDDLITHMYASYLAPPDSSTLALV